MSIDGVEINVSERLPKVSRRRIKHAKQFKERKEIPAVSDVPAITSIPEPEIVDEPVITPEVQDQELNRIIEKTESIQESDVVNIPEMASEEEFVAFIDEYVQPEETFNFVEQHQELNIEEQEPDTVVQAAEEDTDVSSPSKLTLSVPMDTTGTIDVVINQEEIEIIEYETSS